MGPSIFPAATFVSGELYSPGDVEIRGRAEADIECRFLRVTRRAHVTGRIVADRVRVEGQFAGEIQAVSVELAATARTSGEIWYGSLQIEPGASTEAFCGVMREGWQTQKGSRRPQERGEISQIA